MPSFTVTYLQEATQPVRAPTLAEAGQYAKNYAATHGMKVLQVYPEGSPPIVAPPAAA